MALTREDREWIAGAVRDEGVSLRKWANARLNEMEERVGARLDGIDGRLDGIEREMRTGFANLDRKVEDISRRLEVYQEDVERLKVVAG